MIERFIRSELTLKRYRRFKANRLAVLSVFCLLVISFFSFTAEMWANNKPVVLSYHHKIYFPVFKYYDPSVFGITDEMRMDYRQLKLGAHDWEVWPIVRWNPYESNMNVTDYPSPPSHVNWLGTDDRGRDVFARLLYGFRYSMIFAVATWFFAYILGIVFGAVMGYAGGIVDLLGVRIVEVFQSMPLLMLLLVINAMLAPGMALLIGVVVIFNWMSICLYVRAELLKWRKREFVEAARALGLSRTRIIFKHILPNAMSPVLTFSPLVISANVVLLAYMDYLGFGLQPPIPSWGELLDQAQSYFSVAWWLAVFPTLALVLTLMFLNLIGQGVREALDPRSTAA